MSIRYEATIIDGNTGEVQERTVKMRFNGESNYIKMYIDDEAETVIGVSPIGKMLLSHMSYATEGQLIALTPYIRKYIAGKCGVSVQAIKKEIAKMIEQGVLEKVASNTYQVNPMYFGRGDWKDIKRLREKLSGGI